MEIRIHNGLYIIQQLVPSAIGAAPTPVYFAGDSLYEGRYRVKWSGELDQAAGFNSYPQALSRSQQIYRNEMIQAVVSIIELRLSVDGAHVWGAASNIYYLFNAMPKA